MDDLSITNRSNLQNSIVIHIKELIDIRNLLNDFLSQDLFRDKDDIIKKINGSLVIINRSINKKYIKIYLELILFKRRVNFLYRHKPIIIKIDTNILIDQEKYLLILNLLDILILCVNNITISDDEQDNLLIKYVSSENFKIDPSTNNILLSLGATFYSEKNLFLIPCKDKIPNNVSVISKKDLNTLFSIDKKNKVIVICEDSFLCVRILLNKINRLFFDNCNEIKIQNDIKWEKPNIIFLNKNDYTFIITSNGQLGFDILSMIKTFFVITDIEMPELNGLEMINRLHSNGIYHRTIISSTLSNEIIYQGIDNMLNYNISILQKGSSEECLKETLKEFFSI